MKNIKKIAFIGNYLPRQCGIATFTTDICESFAANNPGVQCFAVPITDIEEGYHYPERVRFEIREQDLDDYRAAADFLNLNNVDIVCLQHEYGIFGGKAGGHVLSLLRNLRMPLVTTLHTVLENPSVQQRRVMDELLALSDYVVVMSRKGVEILRGVYRTPPDKVRLIPHGIPDVPFIDPSFYKDKYDVEGKTVLLTFGLLAPNKGIEVVLRALPAIIKQHPNVVYLVAGVTHPNLLRHEGEKYRLSLQLLADELGVAGNVIFHDRFVSIEELKELIVLADVYLTPYLVESQITSGTLAYSFGSGKAVVSTPFWHARELLADGRGVLVPFGDPGAIARETIRLLGNDVERHAMRKQAYLIGRDMTWDKVALQYAGLFEEARQKRPGVMQRNKSFRPLNAQPAILPEIKLDHFLRMTDDIGIFQHARHNVPNFAEGYCTDDNARALILTVLLENLGTINPRRLDDLASRYLGFIRYAWDAAAARFGNFLSFQRTWADAGFSEDSHGRAVWALGTCISRSANQGFSQMAAEIFEQALTPVSTFSSPRAWAFALIGAYAYQQRFPGDRSSRSRLETLATQLLRLYRENSGAGWDWFEQSLSYDNAALSHALILGGRALADDAMLGCGIDSLRWLAAAQTSSRGHFQPVGTDRIYQRGTAKPVFDQQPIEAYSTVSACLEAYRTTKDRRWYDEARKAFQWFLGANDLGIPLYEPSNGGCYDGLHVDRVNRNQGAESTIAFLLSLCEMTDTANILESFKEPIPE
ncbi:MAG: glycosyltransferase family 4 protein [Candidatus Edwardsbacteria bacterium]|jgi:glycosyltransferase involved in cell wall biosynthesis|nr:glycosyltransferase family 4 protein [Candidatus Edwardsbacteria bacterium]